MDTKMDENVRKSWQLGPDQVRFENVAWQNGLDKLVETVAERLGYKDTPLRCFLYKLLVYGEGGHFVKHQDTKTEDGMIATLVVQLPSSHEGGDLVIYRGGEVKHRHDFGKVDGTASFLPHYAVHYADAEHAVEKVTREYRLVLVYSICLPPTMHHIEKCHDKPLSDDLAEAIRTMGPEDNYFAMLLSHEYTKNSIQSLGLGALKGIDAARFHALEEANVFISANKKLKFFIAELKHNIEFQQTGMGGWHPEREVQSILWYSSSGGVLGAVNYVTPTINFLNPGQETLSQLWTPHGISKEKGYMGNKGPTKSTNYARSALFAWPEARHAEVSLRVMPLSIAIEVLYDGKPVDAAALGKFLDVVGARLDSEQKYEFCHRDDLSMRFCRLFCELATDAGDPALVKLFVTEFCPPQLGGLEGNETFVPVVINMLRVFDWSDIGEELLKKLSRNVNTYGMEKDRMGLSCMELALQVLDGLDAGSA
ncbi:hypothetical protein KRP22_002109 [Phytophthora ramorum]|nr:hypothetical protein KRP22_1392 [Phytophthora ramorum]